MAANLSGINGKLLMAGACMYSLKCKNEEEIKHKTGFIVLKYYRLEFKDI